MVLMLWFAVGALVGGIAFRLIGVRDHRHRSVHVVIAVIGAIVGGLMLSPVFRLSADEPSVAHLGVAVSGAVVLLVLLHLLFGRWLRPARNRERTVDEPG